MDGTGPDPGDLLDLVERTSAALAARPAGTLDAAFLPAIRDLVHVLPGADRGSLIQVADDAPGLYLTHTFARAERPGAPRTNLVEALPWYASEILAGRTLCHARLPHDLPDDAAAERAYCDRIGFRANLTVPAHVGGEVVCAVAVGAFHEPHRWPPVPPKRLGLLAELFAAAILRRRAARRLPVPGTAQPPARDPSFVSEDLTGVTRAHVLAVLERCGWRIKGPDGAADRLGLPPSTLRFRMRRLGIRRPAADQRDRSST